MLALSIIPLSSLIISAAYADDTDRLASCIATADIASAAAKDRDAGVSAAKAAEIIERQLPDEPHQRINYIVSVVYSGHQPASNETSAEMLQNCFDLE